MSARERGGERRRERRNQGGLFDDLFDVVLSKVDVALIKARAQELCGFGLADSDETRL